MCDLCLTSSIYYRTTSQQSMQYAEKKSIKYDWVLLTGAFRAIINKLFKENFDIILWEIEKIVKTLIFFFFFNKIFPKMVH